MAIEVANFISELNITLPRDGDLIKEGDDHIRLVKKVLSNTFSGFNKAITINSDKMNALDSFINIGGDVITLSGGVKVGGPLNMDNRSIINLPQPRSGNDGLDDPVTRRYLETSVGMQAAWPIGSIFISATESDPKKLFNFGTWVAFGAGRVLIGQGSGNDGDDVLAFKGGQTGGKYMHQLSTAEMPNHTHTHNLTGIANEAGAHIHPFELHLQGEGPRGEYNPNTIKSINDTNRRQIYDQNKTKVLSAGNHTHTVSINGSIQPTGGGVKHNNVQPYITVYMYQRTA